MGVILPYLNEINVKQQYADKFGGINRADGTPLGEWEELHNMDFSRYPALSSCPPKGYNILDGEMTGCVYKNGVLQYTVPDGIYIDGTKYSLPLSEGEKRLVCMGAYIVILPDFIVCNTADSPPSFDDAASEASSLSGTLWEVNRDWTVIDTNASTKNKLLYLLVNADDANISKYKIGDKVLAEWTHSGKEKSAYMTVQSIIYGSDSDTDWVADGKCALHFETDSSFPDIHYFYLEDAPQSGARFVTQKSAVIRKYIPTDLDFVIEHNNRLWACSSKNHEIYCSKLGEPTCWGDYQGISTDSWAVTVGSDGDFTGAAVYNGKVLFFKEDCVHSIYGTKASNFTLSTVKLRGVKSGCHDSLCISNGLLYYKAPEGIFAYNGTTAQKADARLGEDIMLGAAGCADDRKIYMMMSDGAARVYDCVHDCWSTESAEGAQRGFSVNGCLYALCDDEDGGRRMVMLSGSGGMEHNEGRVPFSMETGWLGQENTVMRHYSKIKLSVGVSDTDGGSVRFKVLLKYSEAGEWTAAYSFDSEQIAPASEIFVIPIIPMRSQKLKIRIEGESAGGARFTLYGLYFGIEEGTEIGGEH